MPLWKPKGLYLPMPRLAMSFAGWYPFCSDKCNDCQGTHVDYWTVTWAGLANDDPVNCNDCNDFNQDWVLDQYQQSGPIHEHRCEWYTELDPTICGAAYMKLVVLLSGGNYAIWACAGTSLNDACQTFIRRLFAAKAYGTTKPNCPTFTAEALSVYTDNQCDESAATCKIAAGFNP